jgi:hypothetical protein
MVIYAMDVILSVLMCAPRSVYPWDIVIVHQGDRVIFDKKMVAHLTRLPLMKMQQIPHKTPLHPIWEILMKKPLNHLL